MPIKVYMSTDLGAPGLTGQNGKLIDLFDAVLVNGYGSVTASSVTRTGTTATVTTPTAHGLKTGAVVLIGGATETDYNGEFVVTVTSPTVYTYDVAGSPTTPATGTITSKRAPAGYTKTFAATNKGVYRSNDVTGLQHYYRIRDDASTSGGAKEATIIGYVTMSDIDNGTDMHPTSGVLTNGYIINKSYATDAVTRHWVLITNGKTVYFFVYEYNDAATTDITTPYADSIGSCGFGDIIPFKTGDVYASFIGAMSSENQHSSTQYSAMFNQQTQIQTPPLYTSNPALVFPRAYTGVSGSSYGALMASAMAPNFGGTTYLQYPHLPDNGFYMTPTIIVQGYSSTPASPFLIRGRMPGYFEPMHSRCFPNTQIIENVQGFSGRKFMFLWGKYASSAANCVIDITGPWDS